MFYVKIAVVNSLRSYAVVKIEIVIKIEERRRHMCSASEQKTNNLNLSLSRYRAKEKQLFCILLYFWPISDLLVISTDQNIFTWYSRIHLLCDIKRRLCCFWETHSVKD